MKWWARKATGARVIISEVALMATLSLILTLTTCTQPIASVPTIQPSERATAIAPQPTVTGPSPTANTGTPLMFQEIGQGNAQLPGKPAIPHLAIITGIDDFNSQDAKAVSPNPNTLLKTDYANYFILIAFREWRQSGGFHVVIRRIQRQANKVTVYADLTEDPPDQMRPASEWIAYDAIKVTKSGIADQEITFDLVVDGAVVASLTRRIP